MKDKIEFIAFDADDTLWESAYVWLWAEEHNAQYD